MISQPPVTKAMRDEGCRTLMWLFDERADAGFSGWAEEVFCAMWGAMVVVDVAEVECLRDRVAYLEGVLKDVGAAVDRTLPDGDEP